MTDKMFINYINMRLTSKFQEMFGESKRTTVVLNSEPHHHHVHSEEVKVPNSNLKTTITSVLQGHGVKPSDRSGQAATARVGP